MPSFDIVSKPDMPSINNAIDGVTREISTRYDFKGSKSKVEITEEMIIVIADDDLKRKQVEELINVHFIRKKVPVSFLIFGKAEMASGNTIRQQIEIKNGISREDSQKIIKQIKSTKSKVQVQIQGGELRVSAKKRDDLQSSISMIKENFSNLPLQFINFREWSYYFNENKLRDKNTINDIFGIFLFFYFLFFFNKQFDLINNLLSIYISWKL